MNDPNAVNSPQADNWLHGEVPGGDTPFSELFGAPEGSLTAQPTTAAAEPSATPDAGQPAPVASPSFELRTRTGTVYKTVEDAIAGIEQKDTLIKQLRERYTAERGVDPITNQPVRKADEPVNYMADPQRFARDLAAAAAKNDAAAYTQTQTKLIFDALQPIAPIISEFSKSRAQEVVSHEIKDFAQFRNSEDFSKVLDSNPVLKGAIEGAEKDVRFSEQLPGLYKLAYAAHTQSRLPELLKAVQAQNTPTQPTNTVKTMSAATITPTAAVSAQSETDALTTSEGRQELMKRLQAQGIDKVVW